MANRKVLILGVAPSEIKRSVWLAFAVFVCGLGAAVYIIFFAGGTTSLPKGYVYGWQFKEHPVLFRTKPIVYKGASPKSVPEGGRTTAPTKTPPTSSLPAAQQKAIVKADEALAGKELTAEGTTVNTYIQTHWCGVLGTGTALDVPLPNVSAGLSSVANTWTSAKVLGRVLPLYCAVGYTLPGWWVNKQLFAPTFGGPDNGGSVPLAIEMGFQEANGTYGHIFFVEDFYTRGKVDTVYHTQLLAMDVSSRHTTHPIYITSPTKVVMPNNAVIDARYLWRVRILPAPKTPGVPTPTISNKPINTTHTSKQ